MSKPTIVLVHGAFADGSGFAEVARRLLAAGYPVVAAANPLRGLSFDAARVAALLASVDGPIVLVGHSYGGAVISAAAVGNEAVRALVYLGAFVPDTGESAEQLVNQFPGSTVGASLKPVPLPDGQVDLYIDPRVFHANFAGDLPEEEAALYAVTQRPASGAALGEPASGPQAWRTIPSFHLISGADRIIPRAAQEFMAKRAGAEVRVLDGASHLLFVSRPGETVAFIEDAARESVG
ncbi:alpha/beta hydrolase [Actinoplanes lobatus]|uniref:Alpha/beta hydrolase n=1 Tax=Actinoplanes lobatus TaxID=113568 RepID=A0A7W7HK08_9ACTN|nr:alpha/beta hydrolase [Actinoplanes lobatus]MBB4751914.1 pimeloyl-ACP methyl ester carboxylesterase [Actinoplanes lobatus]GGN85557.1 alpha/beta hydrolase [Actinoplanes lobatus]GIE44360.1 alpha/beta hydrolase [Actinoplanes lobatus]